MPPAIAIGAALVGGAIATSSAVIGVIGGIGAGILGGVAAFGVNALGSALVGRPKGAPASNFTTDSRERLQTIRSSVSPQRIIYGTAKVGGTLVYAAATGSNQEDLHIVVVLAGHECESIDDIYFNDELVGSLNSSGFVTTGKFIDRVRIKKHLGSADQEADADLVREVGQWTTAHRLRGMTYIYARMSYNPNVFPNGIPNISAVVKGKKVLDTRTSTVAWSENWAMCIRDYLLSDPGIGLEADEVNEATFVAAANISDETVAIPPSGSQKRYTLNGVISLDADPAPIIEDMLSAGAGALVYSQGEYRLYAGAYRTPSISLDEDDLAGPPQVRPKFRRDDLFNRVRGTFVDPDQLWQPTDFPMVENATYEAQDGERITKDVELPFTTDVVRAQRIAKILLEKSRQSITVELPCKLSALEVAVMEPIALSIGHLGWSNKVFISIAWRRNAQGGVDLTLQEEASESYDWNAGDAAIIDPAPNTNLPDPFTVAAPGQPSVIEELYETRGSAGVKALARVIWDPSQDIFVTRYVVEYKLTSGSIWTVLSPTTNTEVDIFDIAPATYDFRVKAINGLGVESEYSPVKVQEIFGLLAPPAPLTGLTLQRFGGQAALSWDQHADLDVRIGGTIRWRWSPAQFGASWATSTRIGRPSQGGQTSAFFPLRSGTYFARPVDSSGVPSQSVASVSTDGAEVIGFLPVDEVIEHPAFVGTKTGVGVDGGKLKLAGTGQFDDIADFDAVSDLDAFGGIGTSGTYEFAGGIDQGSVKPCRLKANVSALMLNPFDLIDDRALPIDEWTDFDGDLAADVTDAQVHVRSTNDDPNGSPTWSDWELLTVGEFNARGFDFRAILTTEDPAYNIEVSELSVACDEAA